MPFGSYFDDDDESDESEEDTSESQHSENENSTEEMPVRYTKGETKPERRRQKSGTPKSKRKKSGKPVRRKRKKDQDSRDHNQETHSSNPDNREEMPVKRGRGKIRRRKRPSSGNSGSNSSSEFSLDDIEYDIGFDKSNRVVQMGKEIKIGGAQGGIYAGKWAREMFEGAFENNEQATWVGFRENEGLSGSVREVPINHNSWFRHTAVFGTTGYGKTSLLKNILVQKAFAGYGFAFIDPKGDGVVELLEQLPPHRLKDVIWIDPNPRNRDKVVGINFFETRAEPGDPRYTSEVDSLVDDITSILKSEDYWGPLMDGVCTNVARAMIESPKPFTLRDMYEVLLDQETLQEFANEVSDPEVQRYTKQIAEEKDGGDLDALVRRLQPYMESKTTRDMIAHRKSTVNISEAVENGKIILVKNDLDNDDFKKWIATGIMRRIWSAVKARDTLDDDEKTPYFLVADEYDDIVSEDADVKKMLGKARSMRLSVTLCCQNPSQLPKDLRTQIFSNCDNLLAMNPNGPSDASVIMKRFGNKGTQDLLSLGKFRMWVRIQTKNGKSPPAMVKTFPDYPPLRGMDDVHDVIDMSLDKYGTESVEKSGTRSTGDTIVGKTMEEINAESTDSGTEPDSVNHDPSSVGGTSPGSPLGEGSPIAEAEGEGANVENEDDDEISQDNILESLYALTIRRESEFGQDEDVLIPTDDVREELERRTGLVDENQIVTSGLFEKIPDRLAEKGRISGETSVRITDAGKSAVTQQDTGDSGSAGKDDHRYVLKRSYELFTRAGYLTSLPTQEGEEQPDGVAKAPIDTSGSNIHEARKKMEELKEEYPEVARISDGRDVSIEAETTTIRDPNQTIDNIAKALEKDELCVLTFKDMSSSGNKDYDHHAMLGARLMYDSPFVQTERRCGVKRFGTTDTPIILDDTDNRKRYAVYSTEIGASPAWWEQGDGSVEFASEKSEECIMSAPDVGELTDVEHIDDIPSMEITDFPAYYHYNPSDKTYIVTIPDGENKRDWETIEYDSKEEFQTEWSRITEPDVDNTHTGVRRFYAKRDQMEIETTSDEPDRYALRADTGRPTNWWEKHDGSLILQKEGGGEVLARFHSVDGYQSSSPDDYPAYYEYNRGQSNYTVVVKDPSHIPEDAIERGSAEERDAAAILKYDSKSDMMNDWSYIYPPQVPEIRMPRMPDDDDLRFVVFPDDDNPEYDVPQEVEFDGIDRDGNVLTKSKPFLKSDE